MEKYHAKTIIPSEKMASTELIKKMIEMQSVEMVRSLMDIMEEDKWYAVKRSYNKKIWDDYHYEVQTDISISKASDRQITIEKLMKVIGGVRRMPWQIVYEIANDVFKYLSEEAEQTIEISPY